MTTETNEGPLASAGGPSLCTKCSTHPRAKRGSWCAPCRAEAARDRRAANRTEVHVETTVCGADDCDQTFEWRSTHPGRKYCSKVCNDKMHNKHRAGTRKPDDPMDRRRWAYKRRNYGITPEEFDEIVALQKGICSICEKSAVLVPDHCHEKLVFRGAICGSCNHLLGKAYDDPAILRRAADYLDHQL